MTAICLVMIVRNEAAVIERCLRSVYPVISRWCIVDTGSTDNTIELVKNCLQDLPGDIYQRPWKNFGHNRTEAIQLAAGKADYNLTIDADETLEGDLRTSEPAKDIYIARFDAGEYSYWRPILFRNDGGFYYKGPVHEELTREQPSTRAKLKGVTGKVFDHISARGGNEKYKRDIELLLTALEDEPHNSRYWFYLAQSHRDSGQDEQAHYFYGLRSTMKGWDEETFIALLERAKLMEKLGRFTSTEVLDAYDKAFQFRPIRGAEVMWRAARYLRLHDKPGLGYSYAKTGARCHEPTDDLLFVDVGAYQWKIYDELAQCALMLPDKKSEAADIFRQLLDHGGIPDGEAERIEQQLAEATNA